MVQQGAQELVDPANQDNQRILESVVDVVPEATEEEENERTVSNILQDKERSTLKDSNAFERLKEIEGLAPENILPQGPAQVLPPAQNAHEEGVVTVEIEFEGPAPVTPLQDDFEEAGMVEGEIEIITERADGEAGLGPVLSQEIFGARVEDEDLRGPSSKQLTGKIVSGRRGYHGEGDAEEEMSGYEDSGKQE